MNTYFTLFNLFGGSSASGASGQKSSSAMSLIMIVGLFALMYFFMIRPQKKKQKEEQNMRDSIQIGDEITTIGGIMGRVVAIKDDEDAIIIETGSDRVKMKFKKWCISTVDTVKEPTAEQKPEKKSFFGKKKSEDVEPKTDK